MPVIRHDDDFRHDGIGLRRLWGVSKSASEAPGRIQTGRPVTAWQVS